MQIICLLRRPVINSLQSKSRYFYQSARVSWSSKNPYIDTTELNTLLQGNTPELRILCSTFVMPAPGVTKQDVFNKERIAKSTFFDIDEISNKKIDLPHMLPVDLEFNAHMKRLDISKDDLIVVYDDFKILGAARAWWMFKAFSQKNVYILNGGLTKWKKDGFSVETGEPAPLEHRNLQDIKYQFHYFNMMVKNHFEMQRESYRLKTKTPNAYEIVDARAPERFEGKVPEPREGLRSGNIPGSKNVFFNDVLNADGTFKSEAEITKVFQDKQVDLSKKIISTCGSGVTACILDAALYITGHKKTSVYDGSWTEYGAKPEYKDEEMKKILDRPPRSSRPDNNKRY